MGRLLVMIEKSYGGETWVNTHAFRVGADETVAISDTDMASFGAGVAITTANTASGGGTNALQRVISFERMMHDQTVIIDRIYISDGLRNAVTTPDYFWSAGVSLPGLLTYTGRQTGQVLAPGTIALVVNRQASGFSSRQGRMFLRGVLGDNHVKFNMRGGVDWLDATTSASYQSALTAALSGSGILTHIASGTNVGIAQYCIPHYTGKLDNPDKKTWGVLKGLTPVAAFTLGTPRSRQMLRGKKRKASTAVAV